MTTHTTFETSRLLAENGFPQPTPEFGQMWQHEEHGNMTFISANLVGAGIAEPQMFYSFCPENGRPRGFFVDEIPKYLVFAPTASDIPLPNCVTHEYYDNEINIFGPENFFLAGGANHAEERAKAWLFLSK